LEAYFSRTSVLFTDPQCVVYLLVMLVGDRLQT